jgi:hypothetical protein
MGSWTQWWAWKQVHNLKGNITGDLTIPGHDNSQRWNEAIACFFWTQGSQEPSMVCSQENGTSHLLLHAHKWFYLQLLPLSVTNLWDLSGMCSLAPPWYSIMQLKCMSISQMTAKHGTISEFHSHANRDIATSWWSLQQLGEMHGYLRGWGSDIWTSEEVILSSLRITSFFNSKALLRYYNLQVFSSSSHQDLFCHMQSCLQGVGS